MFFTSRELYSVTAGKWAAKIYRNINKHVNKNISMRKYKKYETREYKN